MFKCYDRPFLQMLKFSSRYGLYKNVTFAAILLHVARIQKSEEEKISYINRQWRETIICFAYDCKINWYSDTI